MAASSAFFGEIATSIGKYEVRERKESLYSMSFLNLFWGTLIFLAAALARDKFVFSLDSLPTFGARTLLEIVQITATAKAISLADRSTFSFLRILTIPLLLVVDVFLGYSLSFGQLAGINIIVISLIFLFLNHGLDKKGVGYVLFITINAVFTISLFKYDISHFNSVEAEQGIMQVILMIYLFFMARYMAKENPFKLLGKPAILLQSISMGTGATMNSFAYMFAPASVISTAGRSADILFSSLAGSAVFHEKHILIKIAAFFMIISGLLLLTR